MLERFPTMINLEDEICPPIFGALYSLQFIKDKGAIWPQGIFITNENGQGGEWLLHHPWPEPCWVLTRRHKDPTYFIGTLNQQFYRQDGTTRWVELPKQYQVGPAPEEKPDFFISSSQEYLEKYTDPEALKEYID